jgi:hypothetical protein
MKNLGNTDLGRVNKPNGDLIATFLFTNMKVWHLDALYTASTFGATRVERVNDTKVGELESDTRHVGNVIVSENPILMIAMKRRSHLICYVSSEYGSPRRRITTCKSTHYKLFNKDYLAETR